MKGVNGLSQVGLEHRLREYFETRVGVNKSLGFHPDLIRMTHLDDTYLFFKLYGEGILNVSDGIFCRRRIKFRSFYQRMK